MTDRVGHILAPPESRRGRLVELAVKSWRIVRQNGCRNLVGRLWRKVCMRFGIGTRGFLPPATYRAWLDLHEPTEEMLERQRRQALALAYRPLISFITPVFDAPPEVLRETLGSVLAQTYDHWELCLVDGGSQAKEVEALLREFAARDRRVRIRFLETNRGISGNTNLAMAMARGEFLAFLDHDDTVSPDLLFEVVRRLNEKRHEPQADILYFDEDILSADGRTREEPFFKPDWSPDLFLCVHYLTHAVVRRSLASAVGPLDSAMEGAQDWDFMFRCVEAAARIEHIARVLYHWRKGPASSAGRVSAKPYALPAQLRAVESHCRRIGLSSAQAHFPAPGTLRVVWPASGNKVSIIIPTKDKVKLLRRCLRSILERTSYENFEIIVVDNQSRQAATHAYYRSLAGAARVRILDYPDPFNYSTANNRGASQASGELLLFLNNDTEVLDEGWLAELVRWADRPEIGAVGTKLLYPNRTVQHAGVVLGMESFCGHVYRGVAQDHRDMFGALDWYRNYLAVTGACLMMRRQAFNLVGGFDEGYRIGYSDIEICLRLVQQGYRVVYTPFAPLLHYEGRTRFNHLPRPDIRRAYQHLGPTIEAGDPYFNPNLSYGSCLPTLAEPNEEPCRERLRRVVRETGTLAEPSAPAA